MLTLALKFGENAVVSVHLYHQRVFGSVSSNSAFSSGTLRSSGNSSKLNTPLLESSR